MKLLTVLLLDFLPVVGEGFSTSGAMEASREMEEQLGMRRVRDEKEHRGKEKNKEKREEVLEEIIKVYLMILLCLCGRLLSFVFNFHI